LISAAGAAAIEAATNAAAMMVLIMVSLPLCLTRG
jgi:hypothetical protein